MDSFLAHPDLLRQFIPEITDIVDNQLGDGYLSESQIRDAINPGGDLFMVVAFPDRETDADPPVTTYYTSTPRGPNGRTRGMTELKDSIVETPIGVCIGGVFSQSRLASYLNINTSDYPGELLDAELVGVVRTTAVREDVQRNGIGTLLVDETIRIHDEQDVDKYLAVAWRGPRGIMIHDILVDHGMTPVDEFSDYWMQESTRKEFNCPTCGNPCRCSGFIYIGD